MYKVIIEIKDLKIELAEENLVSAKNVAMKFSREIKNECEINVMNNETGEILLTLETKNLNDMKMVAISWDVEE